MDKTTKYNFFLQNMNVQEQYLCLSNHLWTDPSRMASIIVTLKEKSHKSVHKTLVYGFEWNSSLVSSF